MAISCEAGYFNNFIAFNHGYLLDEDIDEEEYQRLKT